LTVKDKRLDVPGSGKIPAPVVEKDAPLRFSFKHLDLTSNAKFCTNHCAEGYVDKLLQRLRDLSGLSVDQFRANKSKSLRVHRIEFSKTSEPSGFTHLNAQLRQNEPYQFMISANEHGRVHGFLLADTFHVVWIDPKHRLYP
jgi:hypothetical protein